MREVFGVMDIYLALAVGGVVGMVFTLAVVGWQAEMKRRRGEVRGVDQGR